MLCINKKPSKTLKDSIIGEHGVSCMLMQCGSNGPGLDGECDRKLQHDACSRRRYATKAKHVMDVCKHARDDNLRRCDGSRRHSGRLVGDVDGRTTSVSAKRQSVVAQSYHGSSYANAPEESHQWQGSDQCSHQKAT